jgi:type IV secretory pathway TrbD component
MNQPERPETKQHLSEAKEAMLRDGHRGLVLINGGAAVTLLAFLQAVYATDRALAAWILVALIPLILGVAAGGISFMFRHIAFIKGHTKTGEQYYDIAHRYIPIGSIVCFIVGVGLAVCCGLRVIFFS